MHEQRRRAQRAEFVEPADRANARRREARRQPAEFGQPGSLSTCSFPLLRRIELHRTRTSFSGLPSFPSIPVSR